MYERFTKRTLDFTIASILLVGISPVFIIIALIIRLTSRGPVIFKQERTGKGGELFTMRKFRTMAKENDVNDKKSGDAVTRVGRVLRMSSLDEIPQLINIIRGDMSFIGPRPWIPAYYENMNEDQRHRNDVRPGITGLAQAYGRNHLSIHEKIAYDLEYVKNISIKEDLKVICVTVKMLFVPSAHELGKGGIYEEIKLLQEGNYGNK